MDRHSTKRPIESSSSADVAYEQSSPPEIGNNGHKRQHLDPPPPPGTFFDLDYLSFGVFDFPWLKDSLIYSKSDDWKFEDVFFTSFNTLTIGTTFTELSGQLLWCNLPDPWEEENEAHVPPQTDSGGSTGEGMDCIWSSLLNQPLKQGSSAL